MVSRLAPLGTAARVIVDFALPPRCPGCGTIVLVDHGFCLACWDGLRLLGDPACARCGLPFETAAGDGAECGDCLADPPAFDTLRAAVAYGEVARTVALRLKYGRRPGLAPTIARLMRRHLASDPDRLIAPVPLHRWRIWRRGYNQAALIARALGAEAGAVVPDLLERVRHTPPLKGMGRADRARTVRGAFRVAPARAAMLRDRPVTLIDDVFTSGATASACAAILRRAGAARVDVLCWARVLRVDGD